MKITTIPTRVNHLDPSDPEQALSPNIRIQQMLSQAEQGHHNLATAELGRQGLDWRDHAIQEKLWSIDSIEYCLAGVQDMNHMNDG